MIRLQSTWLLLGTGSLGPSPCVYPQTRDAVIRNHLLNMRLSVNPLTAKSFNLNFDPLDVVSR